MDPGGSNTWTTRHREHTGHHGFQLNGRTRPATLSHGRASNVKSAGLAKESTYGSRIHSEPWRAHANFGQRAKKLESEILQSRHPKRAFHTQHAHAYTKTEAKPSIRMHFASMHSFGGGEPPQACTCKHARSDIPRATAISESRIRNRANVLEFSVQAPT